VLPLFRRVGCSTCFCYIFRNLAEIEAKRGNAERARKLIDDATDVWRQLDSPFSPAAIVRWRFFGHVDLGEWERAWDCVEESRRRDDTQAGLESFSMYFWTMAAPEVATRVGLHAEASSMARDALSLFDKLELTPGLASCRLSLGLAQAGQAKWNEALRHFEQALAHYRDIGHPWDAANTQYEMGLVYTSRRQTGDLEAAKGHFHEALAVFTELGAEPAARKTGLALETIG
jgi:tetratricopeptide (TPR) repeat protein